MDASTGSPEPRGSASREAERGFLADENDRGVDLVVIASYGSPQAWGGTG